MSTDICFMEDNYKTKKVTVVSLARDTPTSLPLQPYRILSNYLKQYGSYGLHKIFGFRGDNYIKKKWELTLLHATRLLVLLYIPTKYYQIMSKGIKVLEGTRMRLRTDRCHADRYIPRTYLSGDKKKKKQIKH